MKECNLRVGSDVQDKVKGKESEQVQGEGIYRAKEAAARHRDQTAQPQSWQVPCLGFPQVLFQVSLSIVPQYYLTSGPRIINFLS